MNYSSAYPEVGFGGFSRVDSTVHLMTRVHALAGDATTVLDVGCGRGCGAEDGSRFRRSLRDLRRAGRTVIGIDVDREAAANPFIDEFRLIGGDGRWPIDDGSIGLAVCDYVLEHLRDPRGFFAELARTLRPGGAFVARTPSVWSYPVVASRLLPNSLHAAVLRLAQRGRQERDVFPTFYRANSRRRLNGLVRGSGLVGCCYAVEAEPSYMQFSSLAFRVMCGVHQVLPEQFRSTLIVLARKPARAGMQPAA